MTRSRRLFLLLLTLLVAGPLCLVLTIGLAPFWSWLESSAGIESMGHSGPAAWCYAAVYATCVIALLSVLGARAVYRTRRRARKQAERSARAVRA